MIAKKLFKATYTNCTIAPQNSNNNNNNNNNNNKNTKRITY